MKRISGDANILEFKDYKKETMNGNKVKKDDRKELDPMRKSFKGSVDIMEMDETKNPSETESTLEFVLLTLCRALNLKASQSVALLANGNEYLTHCVVKGVKGRFEPMVNWYKDIYSYSKHLATMLEAEIEQAKVTQDVKIIEAS